MYFFWTFGLCLGGRHNVCPNQKEIKHVAYI
jgi:hypothetical protein